MMKNSKNRPHRQTDQVMERFQRARESFNGAWRCRPCAGDFISPSPRPRPKGEQKKVLKTDISKDPLFLKPPQPTPAREDDRLAIEGRQEGHAKENQRKDSKSERRKIDGQLQLASQQDPDGLKNSEERDAADSQSQGGKMNGDLQTSAQKVRGELKVADENESNLENGAEDSSEDSQVNDQLQPTSQRDEDSLKPEDETQGNLERGDEISPQMGPTKTEDLDLFELPKNATVSGEGAGDRVEDLVSPEKQVHGVPEDHFDPLKFETPEEFGTTNSTRPSFPGDQFGAENLESPGDQKSESKESSGMIKSGLNINIPHSESYSLHEAECEKVKGLEENESPVSVLQGIPDLETPKAEDGKLEESWKESESHKSVQGFPEVENHHKGPHLGPESANEVDDPANNIITSLCGFLKLETAQLERPSEDVQRNSSDFSANSNPEKELGTPQAYADSLHQTGQKNFHHLLQIVPKQDSKSASEGLKLDEGELEPESSERLEQLHSKEKNPAVQDSVQNKSSHGFHGNEKHLQISGNCCPMSSQSSEFREEGRDLDGGNLHNAEDEKLEDGKKTNDGLHQKPVQDGGLGGTKHDGFPQSERWEAILAGKGSTLHGMAAASIQGTGEDGSSQLYPDHPDYTELRPISHHGEEHAQSQPSQIHREESNSFKIGIFSVPHVLVVGAITVVSLLGKAASN